MRPLGSGKVARQTRWSTVGRAIRMRSIGAAYFKLRTFGSRTIVEDTNYYTVIRTSCTAFASTATSGIAVVRCSPSCSPFGFAANSVAAVVAAYRSFAEAPDFAARTGFVSTYCFGTELVAANSRPGAVETEFADSFGQMTALLQGMGSHLCCF